MAKIAENEVATAAPKATKLSMPRVSASSWPRAAAGIFRRFTHGLDALRLRSLRQQSLHRPIVPRNGMSDSATGGLAAATTRALRKIVAKPDSRVNADITLMQRQVWQGAELGGSRTCRRHRHESGCRP